jgi:hypothetical protein
VVVVVVIVITWSVVFLLVVAVVVLRPFETSPQSSTFLVHVGHGYQRKSTGMADGNNNRSCNNDKPPHH